KCLTATLIRNTERELVDARRRHVTIAAKTVEVAVDAPESRAAVSHAAPFGAPCNRWDAGSIALLKGWLQCAVGRDADLVLDAVILEKSGRELAESFGLSCAAARQRLGRALARARRV